MLTGLAALLALCAWSAATGHVSSVEPSSERIFGWSDVATFGVFCMALVGPELGTVVGDEIQESRSVVPWSVWRVALLSAACYTLGISALQWAVPASTINSVKGVLAATHEIAAPLGALWMVTFLGVLICVSAIGASVTWFAGASRMLWVAAHDGLFPARFAELSPRFGTPVSALLLQGVLSTAVLSIGFAGAHARQVYEMLVNLSVVLQLIPFLTLFAGLLRAGLIERDSNAKLFVVAGAAGSLASLAGILLSFIPPDDVESVLVHELNLIGACVLFVGGCVAIYLTQRRK
jgi:amino acid transporter